MTEKYYFMQNNFCKLLCKGEFMGILHFKFVVPPLGGAAELRTYFSGKRKDANL